MKRSKKSVPVKPNRTFSDTDRLMFLLNYLTSGGLRVTRRKIDRAMRNTKVIA